MTVLQQVCNWPLADCLDCENDDSGPLQTAQEAAVEFLWRWTGRQFGLCETTVRPCRKECFGVTGLPYPYKSGGEWFNMSCGQCSGGCSCGTVSEVLLPGPVSEILEVMVDGEILPEWAYRVDDFQWLVREDGDEWPPCQNLGQPSGSDGTWSVTYLRGRPVPAGGQLAAGALACELAKACNGDTECRLPKRVQTISRQGITLGFIDNFADLMNGQTGLWEVDSWVSSVRNEPRSPEVYTPDVSKPRQQTWPQTVS